MREGLHQSLSSCSCGFGQFSHLPCFSPNPNPPPSFSPFPLSSPSPHSFPSPALILLPISPLPPPSPHPGYKSNPCQQASLWLPPHHLGLQKRRGWMPTWRGGLRRETVYFKQGSTQVLTPLFSGWTTRLEKTFTTNHSSDRVAECTHENIVQVLTNWNIMNLYLLCMYRSVMHKLLLPS